MTKKFTIECTEAQLLMLEHACEFMSRPMAWLRTLLSLCRFIIGAAYLGSLKVVWRDSATRKTSNSDYAKRKVETIHLSFFF